MAVASPFSRPLYVMTKPAGASYTPSHLIACQDEYFQKPILQKGLG